MPCENGGGLALRASARAHRLFLDARRASRRRATNPLPPENREVAAVEGWIHLPREGDRWRRPTTREEARSDAAHVRRVFRWEEQVVDGGEQSRFCTRSATRVLEYRYRQRRRLRSRRPGDRPPRCRASSREPSPEASAAHRLLKGSTLSRGKTRALEWIGGTSYASTSEPAGQTEVEAVRHSPRGALRDRRGACAGPVGWPGSGPQYLPVGGSRDARLGQRGRQLFGACSAWCGHALASRRA